MGADERNESGFTREEHSCQYRCSVVVGSVVLCLFLLRCRSVVLFSLSVDTSQLSSLHLALENNRKNSEKNAGVWLEVLSIVRVESKDSNRARTTSVHGTIKTWTLVEKAECPRCCCSLMTQDRKPPSVAQQSLVY